MSGGTSNGGAARGRPADAEVAAALEAFVQRALNLPPGTITVDYNGGAATITGTCLSASRSSAIEDLVRWHDGVDSVINKLTSGVTHAAPGTTR